MTSSSPTHGTTLFLLYVDDMIITSDDVAGILSLKQFLNCQFEMKGLGTLNYFLGLEISHDSAGSLVYLTVTCPDIAYAVHLVSQYMLASQTPHYTALLHILPYLKGTMFHGRHYSTHSFLGLRAFFDSDWVGDLTDQRSTTRFCFFSGDYLLTWRNKKQSLTARSSTEAGYRALSDTT
ncbi:uncharacterized protein LOC114304520 [Camellia sinensis]|uniref:uncharacterized protein LOC114304520 n=1 Tax=Camellia sinensis TaxID=4442 RepID=UPI001036BAB4|nr:uncharacterized protein LOC114304520 [Camellia sinensis]